MNQSIPVEITQGETITWATAAGNYPAADGWAVSTYFRATTAPGLSVPAVATGSGYSSTLTAEQTQELPPGRCDWQTWAVRGSGPTLEQYLVSEGRTMITIGLVNMDPNTPYDGRTPLEQQLAALRVSISEAAINGTAEYQIANRAKKRYTLQDLLALEKRLVELVNAERRRVNAASGAGFFKNHPVRPVEPGP